MAVEKTRGCIVRSRARWYESGEKCNKYFLNLTKRSYNKRHIKKLKFSAGSIIEYSKTILNEMKNYYQQLYSSQGQTSPDQLSDFLNSGPLPRLGDFSQAFVKVRLLKQNAYLPLKLFSVTSGTDGLTAEFYVFGRRFLALWLNVLITGLYRRRTVHLSETRNYFANSNLASHFAFKYRLQNRY